MKKLLLITCSLAIAAAVESQVIHVPADYPTIQQGIDAATNGDTVLVSDGTYYEQINLLGKKPLMVASEFLIDGDTSHISSTIIDGSQPTNPDSASVVYFVSGEDTTSVLCGFTITGGTGTTINSPDWLWLIAREGGGIWISGSGAKIMNNHITRNRCDDISRPDVEGDIGGGIATDWWEEDDWIVLQDNIIDSNYLISDTTAGCCTGSGIAILNNCRVSNNIIKNNLSKILVPTLWWSQGTGACIFSMDNSLNKIAIIKNNQFLYNINNSNKAFGGGMKAAGGMHYTISNNTFIGNRVESDITVTDCWGGGLEAGNFLAGSVISNNIFKDNYSEKTDAGLMLYSSDPLAEPLVVENNYFLNNTATSKGGAFGSYDYPFILQNNVFSGNHSDIHGGGLFLSNSNSIYSDHFGTLINNSFYNNTADNFGGAIYSTLSKLLIFNCIFWQDSASMGKEIFLTSSNDTVEIAHSNINTTHIYGNLYNGGGIIYEDPLFYNLELLNISDNSPCVNTGIEEYYCHCGDLNECPHYDIIGTYRPHGGYVDMGAYEFDFGTGIKPHAFQPATDWHSVFPNPFTGEAKLSYELDKKTQVEINLYNSNGELIQTLLSERQEAGKHELQFNSGNLPAGIYFYHITTDSKQATGRMVLLK